MSERRVLVCGAEGYLGKACSAAFQDSGWDVLGAGRPSRDEGGAPCPAPFRVGELANAGFVAGLIAEHRPARIVFAAGSADVQESFKDPVADFHKQTLPLIQVLEAARRSPDPPGVLLISSAAVYGNPASLPVGEGAPSVPISPYGFHKCQQELLLDEYGSLYGLPTCKARVFSTYGPGLRHLAVHDIALRAMKGDFRIWGTGSESRDYLHVRDAAQALETIAREAGFRGEAINVASGDEQSMRSVAARVFESLGISAEPVFGDRDLSGSPVRWRAEVARLRALGFEPQVEFNEGVRETVEWILRNG